MAPRAVLVLALLLASPLAPLAAAQAEADDVTWDFETGTLAGWTATGDAFYRQPTLEDNVAARDPTRTANLQGYYWIGTYEDRWSPNSEAGAFRGDAPTGQLLSAPFVLQHDRISFLVGGSADETTTYVGLRVGGALVARAVGNSGDMMTRYAWDVSQWLDQEARIIVVDSSTTGHVSVDDFRFYDVGGPGDQGAPLTDGGLVAPGSSATPAPEADDAPAEQEDQEAATPGNESATTMDGGEKPAADATAESTPPTAPTPEASAEPEADATSAGADAGKGAATEPATTTRRCEGVDDICKTPAGSTPDAAPTGASDAPACDAKTGCDRPAPPALPLDLPFVPLEVAREAANAPLVEAPSVNPGALQRIAQGIGSFFGSIWRVLSMPFTGARVAAPDPFAVRELSIVPTSAADVAAVGDAVHVAYVAQEDGRSVVRVTTSRDRGATFSDDVAVSAGARGATTVLVGATPQAGVVVAWLERDASGRSFVGYAASTDGGRTFGAARTLSSGNAFAAPQLAMAGRDAHLVWREGTAERGALVYVDAAESSGAPLTLARDTVGRFSVGAYGERVDVAYSYLFRGSADDADIFHVESADGGRTWRSPPENIMSNYGPQYNGAVVVLPTRTALVYEGAYPIAPSATLNHHRWVRVESYREWVRDPVGSRGVAVVNHCACGDSYRAWSNPDMMPLVAPAADGTAHLAWTAATSATGRDVMLSRINADGGVGIVSEVVGRARLGAIDLADAGGQAVVVWEDVGTGEVWAKARSAAGVNVSSSPGASRAPSVAGVPGRAYVAWIDATDGMEHLRFRALDVQRLP